MRSINKNHNIEQQLNCLLVFISIILLSVSCSSLTLKFIYGSIMFSTSGFGIYYY